MVTYTLYNAYIEVSSLIKRSIINFLYKNFGSSEITQSSINEAIDYATKEIPSFGGFIMTAENEQELIGAVIVNKTGLNGGNPKHRIEYFGVLEEYNYSGITQKLIQDSIKYAKGDISFKVRQDDKTIELYQSLGFQPKFIEMRFSAETVAVRKEITHSALKNLASKI